MRRVMVFDLKNTLFIKHATLDRYDLNGGDETARLIRAAQDAGIQIAIFTDGETSLPVMRYDIKDAARRAFINPDKFYFFVHQSIAGGKTELLDLTGLFQKKFGTTDENIRFFRIAVESAMGCQSPEDLQASIRAFIAPPRAGLFSLSGRPKDAPVETTPLKGGGGKAPPSRRRCC